MAKMQIVILVILFLISILIVTVYNRYHQQLRLASALITGHSKILHTSCGTIEYAEEGNGQPLLMVHGAGGGFDQGLEIASPLSTKGFHVIAISRFGYLGSPLPEDASPVAQANSYKCLLEELKIGKVVVFGVSAGAPSALQFAIRYPELVKSIVLMVPGSYSPSRQAGKKEMAAPAGTKLLLDLLIRSDFFLWATMQLFPETMTRILLGTDPALVESAGLEEKERIQSLKDHILPISLRYEGLLNDARIMSTLEPSHLENISAPLLSISTQDDLYRTYEAAQYTANTVSRGRFIGFQTGGHMLVGHQKEVFREILQFLNQ